ncbi:MAG TPA: ATP-dependent Clp protease proteolytic subunit [Acidimicrobiales bacterium]|jgi:ATP-dependent Clp protease protease subunit|nr:ATP-dependent Clp protease proteolytic subunit [Acidimicrobiales bacterium]
MVPVESPNPMEGVLAQLLERRMVLVAGRLDTQAMTDAAAQLMLLDATGDEPIELRLLSEDGDLDPALALADTIDLLGVPLTVIATGVVGGVALAPYCAADRRLAHPRARFVFRDPQLCVDGRVESFANAVAGFQQQLGDFHSRLAAACGQPVARVAEDMVAGLVLTAEQALDYGLVQELATSQRKRD